MKLDTSTLSFSELNETLDNLYLTDPRLRPNSAMHDYQLTYPPAICLENDPVKQVPSNYDYKKYVLGELKNFALYFHFGFCEYKCRYCHHYEIKTNSKEAKMESYLESMIQEMRTFKSLTKGYKSLIYFLGGGTPTSLPEHLLKHFLDELNACFGKSVSNMSTVEVKPITASTKKLKLLVESGFQRINLGVQTLDEDLYKFHHHKEDLTVALDAIDRARDCGFKYINIDILTGIENQTIESWQTTLSKIEALVLANKIDSVFIYPYHDDPRSKTFGKENTLPSASEIAYSEVLARKLFEKLGWTELGTRFFRSPAHRRREIFDFFQSRANPSYGELIYHGFGNSAFSVGDHAAYINHRSIDEYTQQVDKTGLGIKHWKKLDNYQRATRDLTFDILYSPIVRVRSIRKKYGAETMDNHIHQLEEWTQLGLGSWNRLFGVWRLSKLGKLVHQQMISALYLKQDKMELDRVMLQRNELGRAYRGY